MFLAINPNMQTKIKAVQGKRKLVLDFVDGRNKLSDNAYSCSLDTQFRLRLVDSVSQHYDKILPSDCGPVYIKSDSALYLDKKPQLVLHESGRIILKTEGGIVDGNVAFVR